MDAFKNSIEYHDALDRREAQERAEQAEREIYTRNGKERIINIHSDENGCGVTTTDDAKCVCLEVIGDNGECPVHGKGFEQAKADYFSDYGADYQERNDLYSFAIGC